MHSKVVALFHQPCTVSFLCQTKITLKCEELRTNNQNTKWVEEYFKAMDTSIDVLLTLNEGHF